MADLNTPNEELNEGYESEGELYTLVDEDGNEKVFELVDILEEDEKVYFALIPHIEQPEELLTGEVELVVLKVSEGEDGGDILEPIESDEEYERIANIFIDRLDAELDEDEEDVDAE